MTNIIQTLIAGCPKITGLISAAISKSTSFSPPYILRPCVRHSMLIVEAIALYCKSSLPIY
jgi:hypothetical protein